MTKLLTILPGLSMGGAEHMAFELIKNLDRTEYQNYVLCYGEKRHTPLEDDMEQICHVEYFKHVGRITPVTILHIIKKIYSINPDIIHAHMGGVTFAIPWALLSRKPIVITVHTTPEQAFSSKNDKQVRLALKKCKTSLVAVSYDNYKRICKYYGINDHRITYVNNGINIEKFKRKDHVLFTYINVARHDENKNQSAIISAFRLIHEEYSNTRLMLIGDGPCHQQLIEQVNQLGLEGCVVVPGITKSPEIYYAMADVYVQSSHREAMPLSVLEAMATGLPVIATDVGGLKDVVIDNGILIPDDDNGKLYDAMKQVLLCKKEQYEKMCCASKKIVQKYSSAHMAKAYSKIYESLLHIR